MRCIRQWLKPVQAETAVDAAIGCRQYIQLTQAPKTMQTVQVVMQNTKWLKPNQHLRVQDAIRPQSKACVSPAASISGLKYFTESR